MSRKSKGANTERELIHSFHRIEGWCAVRVAGSGSNKYPSPDIVAGNSHRYLAIECKASRDETRYIDKTDLQQLRVFAARFGAEPWVAVRFMNCPWYFLKIEDLKDTGVNVVLSKSSAIENGVSFERLIGPQDDERFKNAPPSLDDTFSYGKDKTQQQKN